MPTYKTPNVYVEETSKLPPSVASVSTAVPVFIGYTEKAGEALELKNQPTRISNMLEYEALFGGAQKLTFTAQVDADDAITSLAPDEELKYLLHPSLQLFYKNGGGACYIISLGAYGSPNAKADYEAALKELAKQEEPTLIALTDAVNLALEDDYYALCQQALEQCAKLKDRFLIIDVLPKDTGTDPVLGDATILRDKIGTDNLKYGAAYCPYLNTTLTYAYNEDDVSIEIASSAPTPPPAPATPGTPATPAPAPTPTTAKLSDDAIKIENTVLYNNLLLAMSTLRLTLPPSAAVAGAYSRVDNEVGVWKAPANVDLKSVTAPVVAIGNADQGELNVHTSGKSINVIRFFSNKGTLIWGARTLAGNSNEWRYVPVRRLFNFIEESIQKASMFAVFEPNVVNTWVTVKIMVENYLFSLYQQGALAGATPQDAYYVKVGLGETMTKQDILEGRLKFEIGVAAVRPAEFIILQFSHKLQEAA